MPTLAEPEGPPSGAFVAASYAVVLLLTTLLALWGAFLVPFRVGGVLVPVSWVLAVGGNVALVRAGSRLLGRIGATVPGLLWVVLVLALTTRRAEGDLIVVGTLVGSGYLLIGALASAFGYALSARPSPAAPERR